MAFHAKRRNDKRQIVDRPASGDRDRLSKANLRPQHHAGEPEQPWYSQAIAFSNKTWDLRKTLKWKT